MNNWKNISQIAVIFSIVFIIFAVVTAIINYQGITLYSPLAPTSYVLINIISAMLPFILFAVLSFVVAAIGSRAAKEKATENEITIQNQEPIIDKEV